MAKFDSRTKELARIVVDYSTEVKKGDLVLIKGELIALPFLEELEKNVIDKKAYPVVSYSNPTTGRYFLENADHEQLVRLPKFVVVKAEECDVSISVDAIKDPMYLQGVDPKRIADLSEAGSLLKDIIIGDGKKHKGKRWLLVGYPSAGIAKLGGMTLREYTDVLFNATNIDWKEVSKDLGKVKDTFDDAEDVHICVPGKTDIHLSLKGRGGKLCDGKLNMPDGEVFYGPVEDSAEGYITFSYPTIRDGNLVDGIRIEYKAGEVVDFSAKKNQEFLEQMLAMENAKRIGEFGIGCNYGIQRYMKNLLFDEKIGGTIHLALGMSYALPLDKGGGLNKSPIHWDIVCDLRKNNKNPGGQIKIDGKLVQENGLWLF